LVCELALVVVGGEFSGVWLKKSKTIVKKIGWTCNDLFILLIIIANQGTILEGLGRFENVAFGNTYSWW
jgi:hypothetical protein